MTFKIGDKVRFKYDNTRVSDIMKWRHKAGYPTVRGGDEFTVKDVYEDNGNIRIEGYGLANYGETWDSNAFVLASVALRIPSVAADLRLYPQDRVVLRHLKQGKSITPMKAMVVYGLTRLAAHIHRIKQAGYDVVKEMGKDESGQRYAIYKLTVN